MDNLATQVYALISGAVMATVNAIFFCKLYICFKLKRRRFSTLQSSILSYFALLFAFCSMILVERIINLIEDNQRVTTPGAIALISAFNTVVILSANSAVAIFFMSNITHLFKDTYLAINSLLLKSLLCITLILTIPAIIGVILYYVVAVWDTSFNYQLIYFVGAYPYIITFFSFIITLNIIIINRLYRFASLTAQNDRNLSSEINAT
eukprot:118508_1